MFKNLKDQIRGGEKVWKDWYEDNAPESLPVPDYEAQLANTPDVGAFNRLLLIRSLRMDRTLLCISDFIKSTAAMGPRYIRH